MRKYLIIAGILLSLAIIFLVLNMVNGKDTSRADLDSIFNNEQTISALSQQAITRGSVYGLKVVAANVNAIDVSNSQQLAVYYKKRYGKTLSPAKLPKDQDPAEILKKTENGADFDGKYKELTEQELASNITTIRSILDKTTKSDLKALLNTTLADQNVLVEQLKNLP